MLLLCPLFWIYLKSGKGMKSSVRDCMRLFRLQKPKTDSHPFQKDLLIKITYEI